MTGTTASTITARSAHREWATRPPDERFASVYALHEAARARRLGTMERRIDTGALGTLAVTDDELALCDPVSGTAPLTHWSFEQLATIAGAPPKYLRSLPRRSPRRRPPWWRRGCAARRPQQAGCTTAGMGAHSVKHDRA
jgi:hypothetical protein